MQPSLPDNAQPQRTIWRQLLRALHEHLYGAKLIIYSSFLVVGVAQIVIRERFPQIHPPWPWIAVPLMIVLFGILIVPPFVVVIRLGRRVKSGGREAS